MGVLDHHDRGVDHGADGDGDAAETHDVRAQPQQIHAQIGDQHAKRQRDDRHQRAAHMQQEHHADDGDDDAFLDQSALERVDGAKDQVGAVIDRIEGDALRQAGRNFGQPVLDVLDDGERVLAEALQHDAGNNFSLAVHFGDAAALVRRQFDARDVAQQHRHAALVFHHDLLEIGEVLDVAASAHHEFGFGEFDGAAADVDIARAQRVANFRQCDAERLQPARVDHHAVLLDEAADAGDLGDALRLGEAVADVPILDAAQFRQALLPPRTTYW